jgi:hypothetical protein
MKTVFSLLASLIFLLLPGCSKNEPAPLPGNVLAFLKGHSPCHFKKSAVTASKSDYFRSCVAYSYVEQDKHLRITHINAGFNCCPDSITATITQSGDTIFISEQEQSSACDCNCLYDLEYEFLRVEAKTWVIRFNEPYAGDMEKLYVKIDLIEKTQDTICVSRESYPWGY